MKFDNLARRVAAAVSGAVTRVKDDISPLLQATAAATIAWALARTLADHPDPFFAPIAAVIAMNAEQGERGINALRFLSGMFIWIIVAELTLASLGGGYGRLALATAVAMMAARAMGGARIVLAQAAGSAILTVVTSAGEGRLRLLSQQRIRHRPHRRKRLVPVRRDGKCGLVGRRAAGAGRRRKPAQSLDVGFSNSARQCPAKPAPRFCSEQR
jgi:hypothetical protein